MKYQNIGFASSLLLHLLFVPFLFYINKPLSQESETIVLDFELNSIFVSGDEEDDTEMTKTTGEIDDAQPDSTDKAQEAKSVVEEEFPPEKVAEIVTKEEPILIEEVQEIKNIVEEVTPLPEKMVELTKKTETESVPVYTKSVTKKVVNENRDESRDMSEPESDSEKATQNYVDQYIRKHFDYINKLVRLNVSYPDRARKRLMEGSVIISFVVRIDGSIKDIIITQSSGYSLLDRNAIKAIKKAVPFPSPPVEATITIPITYRLGV